FMLIDAAGVSLPNVVETLFAEEMGSYLVGVIAAEQAKAEGISNPGFGFVGGVPGATITKFEMGYVQGVRSVFPNARIVDYYANNWGAPELAKAQAKNWFDGGIYCIFSAAGSTGNGVIAQAKEERTRGKKVWAIGVDSDQYEDGLYNATDSAVLTSMLKKVENATYQILSEMKDGKFTSGIRVFDLSIDAVGYSDRNALLAKSAKDAAEKARKDILSGKIVVEKTFAGAKAKGLVPASLHAVDD
ncbi:MAG TPA: BMP family ABC transporter substrate-binding protein, partial [Spirochaetaceae bacterium]|nr:BMP family ABC transporter substrate-binding protein [Spirochaetaceae bacterium]